MGGGFGAKNGPGDYTSIAAELARRTGRPVVLRAHAREENLATGNRNATIQRLTAARAPTARSPRSTASSSTRSAAGWSPTGGPMQMLYACENVRIGPVRRRS